MISWWAEWSTYRPSDFLMFSPRIYWRLFESLNAAWWPAQAVFVGAPLAWLAARWRPRVGRLMLSQRGAALCLAGCWWVVAWAFLHQRYAPINWAASAFTLAFALQGTALISLAWGESVTGEKPTAPHRIGTVLLLWALLGHPLLAPAFGRPLAQAEVFGLAPDPTAIGTLGFLMVLGTAARARLWRRLLWLVPMLWCVVSAATLATIGSPQAGVMLVATVLAAAGARCPR